MSIGVRNTHTHRKTVTDLDFLNDLTLNGVAIKKSIFLHVVHKNFHVRCRKYFQLSFQSTQIFKVFIAEHYEVKKKFFGLKTSLKSMLSH